MKRAILCVGVNRYVEPGINDLDYAEADATEVYGFFQHRARYDAALHLAAPDPGEVLDSAREMVAKLAPGDLFVFFFSGHGYEFLGRHLLLCPKARLNRLQFFQETVPVDLLKEETQKAGVDRVFVLDACRKDLRKDKGGPSGFRGAQGLRDIVAAPVDVLAGGAFTLLCACDEGEQAREMPELKRGLFTCALLEEMKVADHAQTELRLDDKWEQQLHARMGQLAALHGMPSNQRPWIKRSGGVPVLLRGSAKVTQGQPRPSETAVKVKCPICGRRNLEGATFECQHCHRDHLCEVHWTEAEGCCKECAEKAERKREEAEQKAREEAARQQREAEARRLADPQIGGTHRLELGGGVSLELCGIPAGEFLMGSTQAERDWAAGPEGQGKAEWFVDEGATPRLTRIRQGFWAGRTEVTVGQWKRFVAETSYCTEAEKAGEAWCWDWDKNTWAVVKGKSWSDPNYGFPVQDEHPVACISWNDAQAFCKWLTEKVRVAGRLPAGMACRLPMESEWEYACRGGRQGTKFWWGDVVAEGKGRLNAASDDNLGGKPPGSVWVTKFPWSDGYAWVSPVDAFGPMGRNGFGLADMLGNLWEWCLDGWNDQGAQAECYTGTSAWRVLRGGSFADAPGRVRCASRDGTDPSYAFASGGFRVVMGEVR